MKLTKILFRLSTLLFLTVIFNLTVTGQATIGDLTEPHEFSILELSTNKIIGGLRLPQLTTDQRDALFNIPDPSPSSQLRSKTDEPDLSLALGLTIYNLDNNCMEVWNGIKWISLCNNAPIHLVGVHIDPPYSEVPLGNICTLTSTIDPKNAPDVHYEWERSFNGGDDWEIIEGETSADLNEMVLHLGETRYRVTATNDIGDEVHSNEDVINGVDIKPYGGDAHNVHIYVGAFWKNDQKGERIIQFNTGSSDQNNTGDWTASVIWYDDEWDPNNKIDPDGVVLANSSPLSLPRPDMNAENYPVTGSQTIRGTAAANETITFRIGLNKHYGNYDKDNKPARYAVVLFVYGSDGKEGQKKQKLFLRQGQGDDYVMRDKDAGQGLAGGNRPYARKFSPYNLSYSSAGTPPTTWDAAVELGKGNGKFTDFPTKAGGFFIYSSSKVFAADIPSGTISLNPNIGNHYPIGQTGANLINNYWNPAWDACPQGYHRPSDWHLNTTQHGPGGTQAVPYSEMRQSLWETPPTTPTGNIENSVWGYYADGYFDRLRLSTSIGQSGYTVPQSAVSTNSINVAYVGQLFYNPNNNASLFFPAGGYRHFQNGGLYNAGARARYWTSTSYGNTNQNTNAWFLIFFATFDTIQGSMKNTPEPTDPNPGTDRTKTSMGMVRCVRD